MCDVYMYVWWGGGKVSAPVHVEARRQLQESVLLFYLSLGYKDQTQVSMLAYWAIALPLPYLS